MTDSGPQTFPVPGGFLTTPQIKVIFMTRQLSGPLAGCDDVTTMFLFGIARIATPLIDQSMLRSRVGKTLLFNRPIVSEASMFIFGSCLPYYGGVLCTERADEFELTAHELGSQPLA